MKGIPMDAAKKFIRAITRWAKGEDQVCTLILLGSYARGARTDRMSDIDLCLFVTDPADYTDQVAWLQQFGQVWVSVTEPEGDHDVIKAIYEPGLMVEVGIYPLETLVGMQTTLPFYLESGYEILVDKDNTARNLPEAGGTYIPPEAPTPETFQGVIQSFWFHVFNTAKYIWRGELWRAKVCDWKLKQDLLQVMGWHASLCRGRTNFTTYAGKHLQEWVDTDTYAALMSAFGHFDTADSWYALEEMIDLFSRLTKEIAGALETTYPQGLEDHFIALVDDLKSNPGRMD